VIGWIVALALAVVALVLVLMPIRIRLRLQGRGEPSGLWALAAALELGPIIASVAAGRGATPMVRIHLLGLAIWKRVLGGRAAPKDDEPTTSPEPAASLTERVDRTLARYRSLRERVEPADLVSFLLRERRRLRIEHLEIDLAYSFVDIALTGKILGAICALSPLLPATVVIVQRPSWESVDRAELSCSGAIRLWPGLALVDSLVFVLRHLRKLPSKAAAETT
jgi:hypothetical protein